MKDKFSFQEYLDTNFAPIKLHMNSLFDGHNKGFMMAACGSEEGAYQQYKSDIEVKNTIAQQESHEHAIEILMEQYGLRKFVPTSLTFKKI